MDLFERASLLEELGGVLAATAAGGRVVLLAGELVANAVVHARTEMELRVELRGDRLHIAVHDGSPRLLHLVPAGAVDGGGHGLRLVEEVAKAWGVHQHPDGGKVVWCTLDL